ncbi:hypothetical protein ACH5TW_11415 [Flavobacteriaceae bacterium MEBiC06508]
MNENHVWFTSSFFYDIKKWHLVLAEIENFILYLKKDEFIYYQASLNYIPVCNIQFAILCKDEHIMDKIGRHFFEHFTKFKEKNRPQKYIFEVKGIGIPYPTNTFQIGLYSIPYSKNGLSAYNIQENLTLLMFSGLKTEEFTQEDIHTLAIYATITLGKAIIHFNQQVAKSMFINIQNDYFSHGQSIKNVFPEEYNEILNLTKELLSVEDIKNEEPWLADWFEFCKTYINKYLNNQLETIQLENKINEVYINKINLIVNQLGIQTETSTTLLSLVNCSLTFNT